jgi:hypothetical protein
MVGHGVGEEIVGRYGVVVDDPLADAQMPEEIGVADRTGGRDHGDQHDGADEELGEADPTERAGGEPGGAAH